MKSSPSNITQADFESLYIRLREKEGRLYSDEEVAVLPAVKPGHIHSNEWKTRAASMNKLLAYLEKRNSPMNILEIGCGNGWLSRHLATLPRTHVTGTDINYIELQQAARVFAGIPNLHFMYAQAEQGVFKEARFDIILFAASIQYFESLASILTNVLRLLKPGGQIHIIDSHFYSLPEISAAKQRSLLYYQGHDLPEMADRYFHHHIEALEAFDHMILYNPQSIFNRFLKHKHPFHWILVKNTRDH